MRSMPYSQDFSNVNEDRMCLLGLGVFLVALSFPILRDLDNLPTKLNVDAYQHLSFAYTYYDAVRNHGELPLWNPYFGGGVPWAGYIYNPGISPWGLIFALFGDIAGMKVTLVLSLVLGGLSLYGVARKVALLSPAFSLFATLLFLSSNWMAGRIQGGNYAEFSTYFWFLAILCFHELLNGRLLGLLFPYYFVVALNPAKYTAFTALLAGLVIVLCSPVYKDKRRIAVFVWLVGVVIGLLLAMPKILPMIALFRLNLVDVYVLKELRGYTPEEILGRLLNTKVRGHDSFAVGWVALCLAGTGILLRWRDARAWIILLALSCVLALGAGGPFPLPVILTHTPIFSSMEKYGKYFNIYILTSVCLLAAFGFEQLFRQIKRHEMLFKNRMSGKLVFGSALIISIVSLAPPSIPTFKSLNSAFAKPQPSFPRENFYQLSYKPPIGKNLRLLRDDDQYNNVRHNIGTITWHGNIVLRESAIPRFIIDEDGEHPNQDYIGEVAFIGPSADQGQIKEFLLGFNEIKIKYNSAVPQTLLLNFNFNRGWSSSAGQVEEHNGLLSVKLGSAVDAEVVLSFIDPGFTLGCYIALVATILFGFFYVCVRRSVSHAASLQAVGHLRKIEVHRLGRAN
jgi:hypothetical protein